MVILNNFSLYFIFKNYEQRIRYSVIGYGWRIILLIKPYNV